MNDKISRPPIDILIGIVFLILIPLPILVWGSIQTASSIGEEIIPGLLSPNIDNYFSFYKMAGVDYLTKHNPFISYLNIMAWIFNEFNHEIAVKMIYYVMAIQYYSYLFFGVWILTRLSGASSRIALFIGAFICLYFYTHSFYVHNWSPVIFCIALNVLYFLNNANFRKLVLLCLINLLVIGLFCFPYQHAPIFLLLSLSVCIIYPLPKLKFIVFSIVLLLFWIGINLPILLELMVSSSDSSRWLFFGHPESNLFKNLIYGVWQQKENIVFVTLVLIGRAFWGNPSSPFTLPRLFMLFVLINAYKLLETVSWAFFGKSQNFQYFAVGWYVIVILICFLSGPFASAFRGWRASLGRGFAPFWLSLAGIIVIFAGLLGIWEDYYYMARRGGENVQSLYANPVIEALRDHRSDIHERQYPYNRTVFLGRGPEGGFPGSVLQFYGLDTLFGYSANMHKAKEKVFRAVTRGIHGETPYSEPLNSYYRKYLPLDFGSDVFCLSDHYDIDLLRLLRVQLVVSMRPISSPSVELVEAPSPNLPQHITRLWAYEIERPAPAVSRLSEAQWESLRGRRVREQLDLLLGYQHAGGLFPSKARIAVDGAHLRIDVPRSECGCLLLVPYDLLWPRILQDNENISIQGSVGRYLTIVRVQSAGVTRFAPISPWQHCLNTLKTAI